MTYYTVTAAAVFIPAAHRGQTPAMLYRGARIPDRTPEDVIKHLLDNNLIEQVGEADYAAAPQEGYSTSGPDVRSTNYGATNLPDGEFQRRDH